MNKNNFLTSPRKNSSPISGDMENRKMEKHETFKTWTEIWTVKAGPRPFIAQFQQDSLVEIAEYSVWCCFISSIPFISACRNVISNPIQFIFLTLLMTSSWYYTAFLADWATLNLKSHKSISVLFRSQAHLSQNDLNDSLTVKWRIITDRILNFSNYDPL